MRATRTWGTVGMLLLAVAAGWRMWGTVLPPTVSEGETPRQPSARPTPSVFTPAHRTLGDAVEAFFGIRPEAVQPIAFSHRVHVENDLGCTDYCHPHATEGPQAGLPSLRTCMLCHATIATEHPEIQKMTAYEERGEDVTWQRVFGFVRSAHVRFNHAPHVRADVACATCHGDVGSQTVAQRLDLTMGQCIDCHEAQQAAIECVTCHF
ncbi:MAG: hypothetical protein GEU99_05100 [Luteitalea sp.]|nr:hypothetical protein [Luteitalea sp.]